MHMPKKPMPPPPRNRITSASFQMKIASSSGYASVSELTTPSSDALLSGAMECIEALLLDKRETDVRATLNHLFNRVDPHSQMKLLVTNVARLED